MSTRPSRAPSSIGPTPGRWIRRACATTSSRATTTTTWPRLLSRSPRVAPAGPASAPAVGRRHQTSIRSTTRIGRRRPTANETHEWVNERERAPGPFPGVGFSPAALPPPLTESFDDLRVVANHPLDRVALYRAAPGD